MDDFFKLKQLLPDSQDFIDLRLNHKIYVDKTALIFRLVQDRSPKFFSRPRRFGKSTIVSLLEELFTHGVKPYDGHDSYFKGLAIGNLYQDESTYFVLHFDMAQVRESCNKFNTFEKKFKNFIQKYAKQYQVTLDPLSDDVPTMLEELVRTLGRGKVVLLIDEFDAPLTYFLDHKDYQDVASLMQSIYGVIKRNQSYLRFVFITGITRYKDASLITEGNTINDISQDETYASLCGFTRSELKLYFQDHLRYVASQLFKLKYEQVLDAHLEQLLDILEKWYDGYAFGNLAEKKVFSTWSIIKLFSNELGSLICYWVDSAPLPSIFRRNFNLESFRPFLEQILKEDLKVARDKFLSPTSLSHMDKAVLLFQCGYLTLKESFGKHSGPDDIVLTLPNKELTTMVNNLLAGYIFNKKNLPHEKALFQALQSKDVSQLAHVLGIVLETVDYEKTPLTSEAQVVALIQVYLESHSLRVSVNAHQQSGRADSIVIWDANLYLVIEYKFIDSDNEAKLDAKLEEAILQMQSHAYGKTLSYKEPCLWRVCLVYSKPLRKIARFATVDLVEGPF